MSFEEAKQTLQMEEDGQSLYDHLASVSDKPRSRATPHS